MENSIKVSSKIDETKKYEFVDQMIGSGGMKDVYFSPDKTYVIAFYRDKQDVNALDRLKKLVTDYRRNIFELDGGDYWKDLYCWPEDIVEFNGKLGIICPVYKEEFFFKVGSVKNDFLGIKGKEKEGKWFASAKNINKYLAPVEKGDWFKYLQICIRISRAVKRLHAAGLAHSDLSYKNVLIDPVSGKAAIIDIDGLVVPGKFPPDVLGTPDFIAPEVMSTKHLDKSDPNRMLPNIHTDRHALAVLIYMYLLFRHPLRGGKVHDLDTTIDEELSMGANALFIEHPNDKSNRVKVDQLKPEFLPQGDPSKLPYTICGPYLKDLFDKVFIDGLQDPNTRPTADEWERALLKTVDLLQPCQNPACSHKWFVFDNTTKPRCPFCGTEYRGKLPILNLYSSHGNGSFRPENYRLMVYDKQLLYMWHVNRFISANERTTSEQKKPVGDFHYHNNQWILINRKLTSMYDKTDNNNERKIEINEYVELTEGKKILLSTEDGGRLMIVQLLNN